MSPDPSRLFRLAVVVGVFAVALVGAGCGGGGDEEYREGLAAADQGFNQELTKVLAKMQAAARAKAPDQYQAAADQLDSATADFKRKLDDLDTPDGAEDEEAHVNASVDRFNDTIGRIAAAVQSKDTGAIRAEESEIQSRGDEVARSVAALKGAVD